MPDSIYPYTEHDDGVVLTQPRSGEFERRPMTPGELAAREPALKIAKDIYRHANQAGVCYYEFWLLISRAIDAQLSARPEIAPIDPGTEKILRTLLDRAYKIMLMAIGPVHEQDPDSNDPIVAWASDVRVVLYGSGRVPSLADLQSPRSPQGEEPNV